VWGKNGVVLFDEEKVVFEFKNSNSKILTDNLLNIFEKNSTIYVLGFNEANRSNKKYFISILKLN
jgi:hypothetical protein